MDKKLKLRNAYDKFELIIRLTQPFFNLRKLVRAFPRYIEFFRDLHRYSEMSGEIPFGIFRNLHPCLHDKVITTPFDSHYFYQDIWAFKHIKESNFPLHVDIASRAIYVGILTSITEVIAVDIRPLKANLPGLKPLSGSIVELPFRNESVVSLSCLHVAEHIGLGRYGDPLDPEGTRKAAMELERVLAPGGNLYFSLPVGRDRLCFNAHRIHDPLSILQYFSNLDLVEFSGVDDGGQFVRKIEPSCFSTKNYSCGMFWFRK